MHVVEEMFGKELFDRIQGQREGVPRKPDPAAAFAVRGVLVLLRANCISEIQRSTLATGNAADMDTVGVTWGFRRREELGRGRMRPELWQSPEEILDTDKG